MSTQTSIGYNEYTNLSRLSEYTNFSRLYQSQSPPKIKNSKDLKKHSQKREQESSQGFTSQW